MTVIDFPLELDGEDFLRAALPQALEKLRTSLTGEEIDQAALKRLLTIREIIADSDYGAYWWTVDATAWLRMGKIRDEITKIFEGSKLRTPSIKIKYIEMKLATLIPEVDVFRREHYENGM